ncbi:MAG: MOSC domain-containing protein [bacterium]|nr:MOSC domain-containing protein [bacterium]
MFKIEALNTSIKKGTQKQAVDTVSCIENFGIKDDAHAGKWHRQVSFLAGEAIDSMRAKAKEMTIAHGAFGENVVTRGFDWSTAEVGAKITIGDVEMEVTQIGKECHSKCAIYDAVGDCIMPRQGIFAKVLKGGDLHAGDSGHYNI